MRPAGPIRRAVLQTARELAEERAPTWLDVANRLERTGFGRQAVRNTWNNLTRYGHLQPVGDVHMPHSNRPLQACVPRVQPVQRAADGFAPLQGLMRAWVGAS